MYLALSLSIYIFSVDIVTPDSWLICAASCHKVHFRGGKSNYWGSDFFPTPIESTSHDSAMSVPELVQCDFVARDAWIAAIDDATDC